MSTELAGTPELDQLQYDLDVATTAYDKAAAAAGEALKLSAANLKSTAYIADCTDALNKAQAELRDALAAIAVARGAAKKAAYHPPSVKLQGKAVVDAVKGVATMEKTLLKTDSAIDAMFDALTAKEGAQMDREIAYEKGCAALKRQAGTLADDASSLLEAIQAMHANALKAAARGNTGSLQLAQDDAKSLAIPAWLERHRKAKAGIESLKEQQDQVGSESRQAAMGDLRDARLAIGRLDATAQKLQALREAILKMTPQAIDVAKLAKKLGIPDGLKAALGKALAVAPAQQPKALDEVARSAGIKQTGKAILAMLQAGKA